MLLQLDPAEFKVVADVLRRAMRDLRDEIHKTEVTEFEAQLKQRAAVLDAVLQHLAAAEASGLAVGEPASRR